MIIIMIDDNYNLIYKVLCKSSYKTFDVCGVLNCIKSLLPGI